MTVLENAKGKSFHFVGIGGIGMSGIAEIMLRSGYKITGSDIKENYNTKRLEEMGAAIFIGHKSQNAYGADVIVVSSAIKQDNPELAFASAHNLPIVARADILAELMKNKKNLVVAGSHGKTTTTSLADQLLNYAGYNPTVINGGIINSYGTNAKIGTGNWLVAESDESDGSFIKLPADIGIITNIDPEHLDYYGSFEKLLDYFKIFIERISITGCAIMCTDNENCAKISQSIKNVKIITYGVQNSPMVMAENIKYYNTKTIFDVKVNLSEGEVRVIDEIEIPLYGQHNVCNALSVICAGIFLQIDQNVIKTALTNFKGVKRRFTRVGQYNGAAIIDDYAHHPKEIMATIQAAKNITQHIKQGKVIALIQPHRYSRLASLMDEFAESCWHADIVIITDVYAANEAPRDDATGQILSDKVKRLYPKKEVVYLPDLQNLAATVKPILQPNDFLLCMGAGDVSTFANHLEENLHES